MLMLFGGLIGVSECVLLLLDVGVDDVDGE
jgi:hypothetical protein